MHCPLGKEVNGKINSFRAFYSSELKKSSASKEIGAVLNDTYESKWAHSFETNLISLLEDNLIM